MLASAVSVPASLLGGLGYLSQLADHVKNRFRPDSEYVPADPYRPSMSYQYAADAIRGGAAEAIADSWAGRPGAFLYQTGMSMADSGVAAALTAGTGLPAAALLGGSAATSAMTDARARGATDGQAVAMGLFAGAAEMLFEQVSIERLLHLEHPEDLRGVLRNAAKQAFTEGSEEVNTTLANMLADAVVMADKSAVRRAAQAYERQGMGRGEAQMRAWMDAVKGLGLDFLGGAISGGVMSGVRSAGHALAGYSAGRQQAGQEGEAAQGSLRPFANRRITAGPVLQRVQEEAAWRPILEALAEESQEALLRAHYNTALSEERSPEALRWNELSALYDLYTRDQFTPQDPAPASQTMEEDGGRALREAALPAHVERLAKALGLEVVVEERLQPTVKGYIQGNAIHLPPSSPDAAMEILRHELTHRMQELSPRQYGKYRDYVIRQYTAADAAAKYEAYRRAGHPLTPEQVVDELVADYAGRHLREEGAIRRLAGENRTLAEWVRGTIHALAERIREKLGQPEPTLEYAQRLWDRAFRVAEQHASR